MFSKSIEKANIIPGHKKDKQRIKNYRPVSLLPICSKIFEKIIFNSLFKYLEDKKILTWNQSVFRPGVSAALNNTKFTNHLTQIPHLK